MTRISCIRQLPGAGASRILLFRGSVLPGRYIANYVTAACLNKTQNTKHITRLSLHFFECVYIYIVHNMNSGVCWLFQADQTYIYIYLHTPLFHHPESEACFHG